jgi:hypothetical protein
MMTYEEFLKNLATAGLKIPDFAALMKMHQTSLYNWGLKDEVPSHIAVISALIAAMAEAEMDYRAVIATVDITPKKTRGVVKKGKAGERRME